MMLVSLIPKICFQIIFGWFSLAFSDPKLVSHRICRIAWGAISQACKPRAFTVSVVMFQVELRDRAVRGFFPCFIQLVIYINH